jgi:Cdc6-like AAA superfamily ATPase
MLQGTQAVARADVVHHEDSAMHDDAVMKDANGKNNADARDPCGANTGSSDGDETRQKLISADAKLTAITRATLHLGDNSYSFVNRDKECHTKDSNTPKSAPIGWKDQYDELFSLLKRGLLGYDIANTDGKSTTSSTRSKSRPGQTNVSAVLMGPRGQGKSFILERCLSDLSALAERKKQSVAEGSFQDQVAFRVVRLNGLLYAGDNAVACAREIARQIGEMAGRGQKRRVSTSSARKRQKLSDGSATKNDQHASIEVARVAGTATPDNHNDDSLAKSEPIQPNFKTLQSGFNSNLSLLDESLRTARIDNIPILIILEDLDTFIAKRKVNKNYSEDGDDNSNDRQLLLYHLLDRVADHKFLVSVVGLTTNLSTVQKFEKRVLSRAEGTSKFIYFGRMLGYDDVVEGALMAFHTSFGSSSEGESVAMMALRKEVEHILHGGDNYRKDEDEMDEYSLVRRVLEHNYEIRAMDMRWFCRVLDVALGLLASDIEEKERPCMKNLICCKAQINHTASDCDVKLTPRHMAMALSAIGARVCDIVEAKRPGLSSESFILSRWQRLLNGSYRGHDPRQRALHDLSGPQTVILLACRRILARDETRTTVEDDVDAARERGAQKKTIISMSTPLTYQRIHDEYTTSFVASGRYTISSDNYPAHLLYRAFIDLIELDLIRLKKDHSNGGPLQFRHCDSLTAGVNMHPLPLYVNVNMELEFLGLLKASALNCSTALREWGLKIN